MEGRGRRASLIALLVLLHAAALWRLAHDAPPLRRTASPAPPLRVELLLRAPPDDPALRVPPPRRVAANPAAPPPVAVPRASPQGVSAPAAAPVPSAPLIDAQGRLRISRRLADELDAAAAAAADEAERAANSFHVPRGDDWILREPRRVLEFERTVFDAGYLPDGMNPVEEACWRNRALAFVLATIGSIDCAAPGQPDRRPPPQAIVYGEDDAAEILRKTDEWRRYDRDNEKRAHLSGHAAVDDG